MFKAVDCQGFAGGFTLGMVQAGFELVGKREMTSGFGVANCEVNRHLLGNHWRTQASDPAEWQVEAAEVVFGNPPCSGFSGMTPTMFRKYETHRVNHCMWSFVEYVARVRPQLAAFESVQQARRSADGQVLMRDLRAYLEQLTGERWTLHHVLHNAYDVGGAALRRRYFWVAARVPFGVEPHAANGYRPVLRDIIGDLEYLGDTWEPQPYRAPASPWAQPRRSTQGVVDGHVTQKSKTNQRVVDLLQVAEWQPRESVWDVARRVYDETGELPGAWRGAHGENWAKRNFQYMYSIVPKRWNYDAPALVIHGDALGCVVHPTQPRLITHREAARVMGYPDDWRILPLKGRTGLQATWGKGITVDCGRWLGTWLRAALEGSPGGDAGVQVGDREFEINTTRRASVRSTPRRRTT